MHAAEQHGSKQSTPCYRTTVPERYSQLQGDREGANAAAPPAWGEGQQQPEPQHPYHDTELLGEGTPHGSELGQISATANFWKQ